MDRLENRQTRWRFASLGLGAAGTAAACLLAVMASGVWLIVSDPVTVATSMSEGDIATLAERLVTMLASALDGLARYLLL